MIQTPGSQLLFFFLLVISFPLFSQDPTRFKDEIQKIVEKNQNKDLEDNAIVFTGSSSIRYWTELNEQFPEVQIVNTGFGGSHMSDLLYYYDKVVVTYKPKKIFIYEGDNDLNDGESPKHILKEGKELVDKLQEALPSVQIYFISAKPSPARWHLKRKYLTFNNLLKEYASQTEDVYFIDIWDDMLTADHGLNKQIFRSDSLHMNKEGYHIWAKEIGKYLN